MKLLPSYMMRVRFSVIVTSPLIINYNKAEMSKEATPVRRQYLHIKQQYPDALLLFRLGDFYEAFEEDAQVLAQVLQIALTSRPMGKGQRLPMAGIPYHALDNYLARLIKAGHKVAICEQMGRPGKGLMPREVIRVVTPGTVVEPGLLESKVNNYLASWVEDGEVGLAYADISTGEFVTGQLSPQAARVELERLQPAEVISPNQAALPFPLTQIGESSQEEAEKLLLDHLGAATLDALGCARQPLALRAAAAVLLYLAKSRKSALASLGRLTSYQPGNYMVLDSATCRHLELFPSPNGGTSLLSVLDCSQTAMGARLLRQWLGRPLMNLDELQKRQQSV
ncbi:MAG: DNA mismatch repair protein MutS, partial [Chloroflexota bacterium]